MRGGAERERRRNEANARQALRDARSDEQQLNKLVREGHGHCKEAEKLHKRIVATTEVTYVLKVNGKKFDTFQATANASEDELKAQARQLVKDSGKISGIRSIVVALGKSVNVKG